MEMFPCKQLPGIHVIEVIVWLELVVWGLNIVILCLNNLTPLHTVWVLGHFSVSIHLTLTASSLTRLWNVRGEMLIIHVHFKDHSPKLAGVKGVIETWRAGRLAYFHPFRRALYSRTLVYIVFRPSLSNQRLNVAPSSLSLKERSERCTQV